MLSYVLIVMEGVPSQSSRLEGDELQALKTKKRLSLTGDDRQIPESSHRDDEMKEQELEKFFVTDFAKMAFHMPPGCGSFWGIMEDRIEMAVEWNCGSLSTDVDAVANFLANFFSPSVVGSVCSNFSVLQHSFLGLDYTLRYGSSDIAVTILHDIEGQCDADRQSLLYGFMGEEQEEEQVVDSGEEEGGWQRQGRRRNRTREPGHGGTDRGASLGGGFRGGGGGRQAGRGRGRGRGEDNLLHLGTHFENMEELTIIVKMSPFSTPEHGQLSRGRTLKARSWEFAASDKIGDLTARLYDPNVCETGRLFLYHGTRHCSLEGFRSVGILPSLRKNEFSVNAAFYVSNSLRHAYEHPLHYHSAKSVADPVSVLVFEIDVKVLHGEKLPLDAIHPFTCKWFQDAEDEDSEWQDFCKKNFTRTRPPHNYDIVIGPICRPSHKYEKLKLKVEGAPLTQVAFCSTRARLWLERSFVRVYMEKRLSVECG